MKLRVSSLSATNSAEGLSSTRSARGEPSVAFALRSDDTEVDCSDIAAVGPTEPRSHPVRLAGIVGPTVG
jgi:hypothetical protein